MSHLTHYMTTPLAMLALAGLLNAADAAAQQGPPPPAFLTTVQSSRSFDATVDVLTQAIESENLMVVHEINAQQMLRMVGVRTGGMKQILYFHPRFMQQIIETNRNGGIVPPLKILVMERPDGGVMVRYHDPEALFSSYQGLEGVAQELKGITERVVASVRE